MWLPSKLITRNEDSLAYNIAPSRVAILSRYRIVSYITMFNNIQRLLLVLVIFGFVSGEAKKRSQRYGQGGSIHRKLPMFPGREGKIGFSEKLFPWDYGGDEEAPGPKRPNNRGNGRLNKPLGAPLRDGSMYRELIPNHHKIYPNEEWMNRERNNGFPEKYFSWDYGGDGESSIPKRPPNRDHGRLNKPMGLTQPGGTQSFAPHSDSIGQVHGNQQWLEDLRIPGVPRFPPLSPLLKNQEWIKPGGAQSFTPHSESIGQVHGNQQWLEDLRIPGVPRFPALQPLVKNQEWIKPGGTQSFTPHSESIGQVHGNQQWLEDLRIPGVPRFPTLRPLLKNQEWINPGGKHRVAPHHPRVVPIIQANQEWMKEDFRIPEKYRPNFEKAFRVQKAKQDWLNGRGINDLLRPSLMNIIDPYRPHNEDGVYEGPSQYNHELGIRPGKMSMSPYSQSNHANQEWIGGGEESLMMNSDWLSGRPQIPSAQQYKLHRPYDFSPHSYFGCEFRNPSPRPYNTRKKGKRPHGWKFWQSRLTQKMQRES